MGSRLPREVLPWIAACVLLSIGTLSAVVGLVHVPKAEVARANAQGQRVIVDPITGAVSGLVKKETPPEPKPAENPAVVAPSETTPAAAAPTPTQAAAPTTQAPPTAPATPAPTTPTAPTATTPQATAPAAPQSSPSATPATAPKLETKSNAAPLPTQAASSESIVSPPAVEITETINGQSLPKRGDKDATAASLYSKRFAAHAEKVPVSIVLMDAGFNAQSMGQILKLPRTVTVAFSPYAPDAQANIVKLHVAGFETWGMLPTMGAHYPKTDPGPQGLISSLPPEETFRRLHANMAATLGSVGFVLLPDETLSDHAKLFAATLLEITHRGLLVLSTHPTHSVDAVAGGNKELLPAIRRADMVIDANASAAEIQSKFNGIQALAATKPQLIVMVPARAQTLELLADWLNHNGMGEKAEIAPLSAMYKVAPVEAKPTEEKKDEKKPDAAH